MAEPIVYIDSSEIRPGKLEEVKKAISELVEFVEEHEPQLISYGFYINEESSAMTVVAVHPDSASMEFHMEIGGPEFRKMAEFIDLRLIEVYGEPSGTVLNKVRQKAQMLGEEGRVVVHDLQAGFARFASGAP
jgi:quinol monooxygenase YgiN